MEATNKLKLFKTAQATISCAHFKAGNIVSVKWDCMNWNGVNYFTCNGVVEYPEHHLTRFVL